MTVHNKYIYFFYLTQLNKMSETLENLSIRNFFTCKKNKLDSSPYCLFSYIYILMNRREIFFCVTTMKSIFV